MRLEILCLLHGSRIFGGNSCVCFMGVEFLWEEDQEFSKLSLITSLG